MVGFAHILKANPYGINQYTKGKGGGKSSGGGGSGGGKGSEGGSLDSDAKVISGKVKPQADDPSASDFEVGTPGSKSKPETKKGDLPSDSIVGFPRQEQAKTFITAL